MSAEDHISSYVDLCGLYVDLMGTLWGLCSIDAHDFMEAHALSVFAGDSAKLAERLSGFALFRSAIWLSAALTLSGIG